MSLTKVTYSMINGSPVSVLDYGIVPNDASKRTANTAALQTIFNDANIFVIEFPPTNDTFYFDSFTLPNKHITLCGYALIGGAGVTLDIDAGGAGLICIDTPSGAPQSSRNSAILGLKINVPKTQTAIRVRNGGLTIKDVGILACGTGIHILDSYVGQYESIKISADYYGIRLGDGANVTYNSVNYFKNLIINNFTGTNPGLPTVNARGLAIDSFAGAVCDNNTFINCDFEACYEAVVVLGQSSQNNMINFWFEANTVRNIGYNGIGIQDDCWINWQDGAPPAAFANVFANTVTRIEASGLVVNTIGTNQISFPVPSVSSASPNVLDAYEEGTWTPTVTRDSSASTVTYTSQTGTYIKIGRSVSIFGRIVINAVSVNGAGANVIQSVPFPPVGGAVKGLGIVSLDSALTTDAKAVQIDGGNFYIVSTAGAVINENWQAGGTIEFAATYLSAT